MGETGGGWELPIGSQSALGVVTAAWGPSVPVLSWLPGPGLTAAEAAPFYGSGSHAKSLKSLPSRVCQGRAEGEAGA